MKLEHLLLTFHVVGEQVEVVVANESGVGSRLERLEEVGNEGHLVDAHGERTVEKVLEGEDEEARSESLVAELLDQIEVLDRLLEADRLVHAHVAHVELDVERIEEHEHGEQVAVGQRQRHVLANRRQVNVRRLALAGQLELPGVRLALAVHTGEHALGHLVHPELARRLQVGAHVSLRVQARVLLDALDDTLDWHRLERVSDHEAVDEGDVCTLEQKRSTH